MKKLLSVVLAAGMLVSSTASAMTATLAVEKPVEEIEVVKTINEPTPEMMEQMIKKVRPLIDVPEEYTEFGWDFRGANNYSDASWNFYWNDPEINGEISVSCDLEGRIISYNEYNYNSSGRKALLPKVSPEELLPVATTFMEKTAPYLENMDLRLREVQYPAVFYNHVYTYAFERYENDIPVPENTVYIQVNHVTGKVESFSASMTLDIDFTAPENKIGDEKAKEILSDVQKMNLSYRLKNEYDEEGKLVDRYAYLIYTPSLSYVSVDAATGKIYTERNTWTAVRNSASGSLSSNKVMMDSMAKEESAEAEGGYQLSEKELEQLAVLESLISKDEATKVILSDKDLYIHDNAYLEDARLSKRYHEPRPLKYLAEGEEAEKEEKYVWNLYFSTPGEMYLGMNATVDAHDGTLLSYSADLPYVYHYEEYDIKEPEIKFTREQAVNIASEFLKKHQSEKFREVRVSSESEYAPFKYVENDNGTTSAIYRAGNINFVRVNEGIDFTYNSFNMGVDRASGKITRYSYSWYDDITFESPKDAIAEKDALMALYENNGFGINYEVNRDYTYVEGKYNTANAKIYTRSVYSLYIPVTTTVRALDGKLINYSGEEITPEDKSFEYTDIENHWARETIKRFTWIGYGPEGDKFRPNDAITGEEFVQLCESVRIYGDSEEVMKLENITRMDAVKLIIDDLGYGKIANLKNVFITDFADNSDFKAEDIGYAAIARGFGLIEGDGENFRPYDTLTRAEALTLLENVIDLEVLE